MPRREDHEVHKDKKAIKMAEEAGSEIVAVVPEHLNKVKQALTSRSNMDKSLKEETVLAVSEMDCLLNKHGGMLLGLESTLEKVLTTAEKERAHRYSELLATSIGTQNGSLNSPHQIAQPGGGPPQTVGLIVKAVDPNTSSHEAKQIIKVAVEPKALKLGVNKFKSLANHAVLVECKSKADRVILENELNKIRTITVEHPKRKLPTLLLMHVPRDVENEEIRDTVIHQNNLSPLEDPVLKVKSTKRTFDDSRHVVIEVSPKLRRKLVALRKIKLHWSMCKVEVLVAVTRCLKCLGFRHTSKFCHGQQKCPYCAEDHHWKECGSKHQTRFSNCLKANTYIHDEGKKFNTNHSAFSKECPKMRKIESIIIIIIIISRTEY